MTWYAWLASGIAIIGTVLNCKQIKYCFCFWIAANVMWLGFDLAGALFSRAILDTVQLVLACVGLHEWIKIERQREEERWTKEQEKPNTY